jgi:predicted MPP superfamily phosphohydrolase
MRLSRWIAGVLLVAAALAGALLAYVAFEAEPRTLALTALRVETPAWPQDVAPIRVVLLSDLHGGNSVMTPDRVRRLALAADLLKPDVVLLAGDYVGGEGLRVGPAYRRGGSPELAARVEPALKAMAAFRAAGGVYAVLGNHDCWWSCARVREILRADGIQVLENAAVRVPRPGGDVWIAGLADAQTQRPAFEATARRIPAGAAVVAMVHNPGAFEWSANRFPLVLSGHTHGGQVRLPLIGAPVRMSRLTEETFDKPLIRDGRILIVTRGVGETGLPVRFLAPPEIMVLQIGHGTAPRVERLW